MRHRRARERERERDRQKIQKYKEMEDIWRSDNYCLKLESEMTKHDRKHEINYGHFITLRRRNIDQ